MSKLITTTTIDPTIWNDFVTRHPLGTIYHHSLWQNVIRKTYGYQPLYHLLLNESSSLEAAISSVFVRSRFTGNRIISYPFSDSCDPLVSNSAELAVLMEAMERTRSELNAKFIELRFAKNGHLMDNDPCHPEYYTYHLSLDRDVDELFRSFHKNCIQRAIKKANQEQLEIVTGGSLQDLKTFYHLHIMTRKKHGVPIQPFRFFKNLWNALFPKGMLGLLLVRHKDMFVAGIIILYLKETAYYKYGASDDRFFHLRANQCLMWEAIQRAHEKGCSRFDFGRASTADMGLAQYKSRWGTQTLALNYLQIPHNLKCPALTERSKQHSILKKLIKLMPKLGIRISGKILYRHLA